LHLPYLENSYIWNSHKNSHIFGIFNKYKLIIGKKINKQSDKRTLHLPYNNKSYKMQNGINWQKIFCVLKTKDVVATYSKGTRIKPIP
jgi:hypothetical protein